MHPRTGRVFAFQDDVTLSWRDMVVLMLTISDKPCTDAPTRALGLDTVNATAARLGLTATSLESDLMTTLAA
jgi:beta-lactamase class A